MPEHSWVMALRNRWLRAGLSALIAALLYLPALGRPALWEPDEGRYAEIAREMVVSGDYVTPRDNYVRYFEKPPLVYWAEAASIHVFGVNEFAIRLPAALFTIGEVAVTCVIGEAMFGAAAGITGAIALALCPLVFVFARFATLDPALAFFITAAIGSFYLASGSGDFRSGAGRRWMLIASAMLALGTLAKGPVALVLGGAIALGWMLIEHRGREISRMPLFGCAALYAVIVTPWFVLAELRNPGFLRFFFVHEHLQRFVSSREHGWGPYFFIPIVLAGAWPWLFFVPTAIAIVRASPSKGRERSAMRLLAIWFAIIFVFFSIPRSKLGSYILPAIAPIAILAGVALSRLTTIGADRARRLMGRFALLNSAIAASAIAVVTAIRSKIGATAALDGAVIAAVVAAGAVATWVLARKGRLAGPPFAAIAIAMILTTWLGEGARIDLGAHTTYRSLARQIQPYDQCLTGSYRHYVQSLPFYTGRREILVEYWGELAPFADSPEERAGFIGTEARLREIWASDECVILIANRKDFATLTESLNPAPRVVGCEGKKLALSNRMLAREPAGCDGQANSPHGEASFSKRNRVLGNGPDGL